MSVSVSESMPMSVSVSASKAVSSSASVAEASKKASEQVIVAAFSKRGRRPRWATVVGAVSRTWAPRVPTADSR